MEPPPLQLTQLDPGRFARLQEILDHVLDLPREEIPAAVERLAGGDAELREQVLALHRADHDLAPAQHPPGDSSPGTSESFLSSGYLAGVLATSMAGVAAPAAPDAADEELGGRHAGPYRLDREIGRGGMGRVYSAHRDDGQFERTVAIKVLKRGLDTDEVLRRFLQERQILARLEHPNIARLLDGGATDDGRPFLAMELVDGVPITQWCEERHATLEERLTLFLSVCGAVQDAHRHLVVHRDLKPGNVLVTAAGQPKLLDFGIARLLEGDSERSRDEPLTRLESLPLTPAYAAPEQLLGEPATTQTDVYGLGVILYELLAGKRPFELRGRTPEELRREILERSPAAPSSVAPERLRAALRGDLDAIALTAIATDPSRRYASVEALSEDLHRYRNHLPVRARKPGGVYRLRKLLRRHAGALGAAAVVLALLVAYAATTAVMLERQRRERIRAETEVRRAGRIQKFLGDMLATAGPSRLGLGTEQLGSPNPDATVREALDGAAEKAQRELRDDPPVLAGVEHAIGETYLALGVYDKAEAHARAALAIRETLGDPHPLAETLNLLSQVLQRETKGEEALRLARRSTALEREHHGAESMEVAIALQNEHAILVTLGHIEEAHASIETALRIGRAKLAPDDPRLIEILGSAAIDRLNRGAYASADTLFRDVLARVRRVYGDEHPRTVLAMSNLASNLGHLERYAEAEAMHREILAARRKLLGPEHPAVATTMSNLGYALREQGKLDEAEAVLRGALAMRLALLGPENKETLVSQSILANLLLKRGNAREAERLHRSVLATRRRVLGPDHPLVATSLLSLSDALAALGRRREAVWYAREAVALRERVLPAGHPDIEKAKARLGALESAAAASR